MCYCGNSVLFINLCYAQMSCRMAWTPHYTAIERLAGDTLEYAHRRAHIMALWDAPPIDGAVSYASFSAMIAIPSSNPVAHHSALV
jgi:hypothetical protein